MRIERISHELERMDGNAWVLVRGFTSLDRALTGVVYEAARHGSDQKLRIRDVASGDVTEISGLRVQ